MFFICLVLSAPYLGYISSFPLQSRVEVHSKKIQAEKEASGKTFDIARHDKITGAGRTGRLPRPTPSVAYVPL